MIGVDPCLISEEKFNPELLPPVEATDLLSYLVLDTSFYTKQQFKSVRSLRAYNWFYYKCARLYYCKEVSGPC